MNQTMHIRIFAASVIAAVALVALPTMGADTMASPVSTEQGETLPQLSYESTEAAVKALYGVINSNDVSAIYRILGPGSADLVNTGDEVADKQMFRNFIAAFDQSHRLESKGDDQAILLVGENSWPFPFPLVKSNGLWQFDASAGAEEIINRRVGENELFAMEFCLAYGDAQREYVDFDHDRDGLFEYAQRIRSTEGERNGLYWPAANGEPQSPLGPLVAEAIQEGYDTTDESLRPYHGYQYRILTGQGDNAPGGAYDYLVNGNMIGGFGLISYPANWGASGVMTFICNHDGVVYQKNLGENAADLVSTMKLFDPDESWEKVAQ